MPLVGEPRKPGGEGLAAANHVGADAVWASRSSRSTGNRRLPLVVCWASRRKATRRTSPPNPPHGRERDVRGEECPILGIMPLRGEVGVDDGQGPAVAQGMFPVAVWTSSTSASSGDRRLPLVDRWASRCKTTCRTRPPDPSLGTERHVRGKESPIPGGMPLHGEVGFLGGQGLAVTHGIIPAAVRAARTFVSTVDRCLPLVYRGTCRCEATRRTCPPDLRHGGERDGRGKEISIPGTMPLRGEVGVDDDQGFTVADFLAGAKRASIPRCPVCYRRLPLVDRWASPREATRWTRPPYFPLGRERDVRGEECPIPGLMPLRGHVRIDDGQGSAVADAPAGAKRASIPSCPVCDRRFPLVDGGTSISASCPTEPPENLVGTGSDVLGA